MNPRAEDGQALVVLAFVVAALIAVLVTILNIFQITILVSTVRDGLSLSATSGAGMLGEGSGHELRDAAAVETMVRELISRNLVSHEGQFDGITASQIAQDTTRTQVFVWRGPNCAADALAESPAPVYCGPFVSLRTQIPLRFFVGNLTLPVTFHVTSANAISARGTPIPFTPTARPVPTWQLPAPSPTP
jgi:hypothetical protein